MSVPVGLEDAWLSACTAVSNNLLLRAYRVVTEEYTPRGGVLDPGEGVHLALWSGWRWRHRFSLPAVDHPGRGPNRGFADRDQRTPRAGHEGGGGGARHGRDPRKALADIAKLRQFEADLTAAETRLKFYEDKSGWLQKRVKDGFEDVGELWNIGQKLHEDRAAAERLRVLAGAQQYRLADYAGEEWQVLPGYLKGVSLEAPPCVSADATAAGCLGLREVGG